MSVAVRGTGLLVCLIAVAVCGAASAILSLNMADEVNARLPMQARFPRFWWHCGKIVRLNREYRRLYPSGVRIRQLRWTGMLMFAALGLSIAINGEVMLALFFGLGGSALIWFTYRP